MDTFDQFLTEAPTSSSDQKAVEDFIDGIKYLAGKYNRTTLERVWNAVTSDKGKSLVKEIIKNPTKSASDLRKLVNR